jgi:competence protein ComEC
MVFQNPKILRFDSSFQLSFLATLALIYLAPYFEKKFQFITKKFNLRGIVSSTLATQIFVLPLLLYKIGILSFVSLPVNLLILPFIPLTMFFGFLTAASSFIFHVLGIPFGWISYAFTQYELWVVKIFASLPFAAKTISNFPAWLMLMIYAFYAIIILKINAGKNKKTI